jgi:ATP-binding cassette subfamily B protein
MRGNTSYHTDDEVLGKVYDHKLMKRMVNYVKPYKGIIALSLLLVFLSMACFLAGPRIIGLVIDKGIQTKDINSLYYLSGAYVALTLFRLVFGIISTYTLAYLGQKIMYDMRLHLFTHLQKMSLRFFDKNPVGRLVTRVTNDITTLSELFSAGVVAVFSDLIMIVGLIGVMFWLDSRLTVMVLLVAVVLIPLTLFFKAKLRDSYRETRKRLARVNAYIAENITGIRVTQLFNREEKNLQQFKDINYDHFKASNNSVIYYALFVPSVTILSSIAIGLILYYGGGEVVKKSIELGTLVTFINYTMYFFGPIQDLADKYTIFQSAMASAERVYKILDTPEEIADSPNPVHLDIVRGEIKFENVWFAYEDTPNGPNYILKNLSFNIKAGERIALVGITGTGKSTIINLLCRFYDIQRGRILIDGVDIKLIPQKELRKIMGVVLQDVFLFSGQIIDNINLGEKDITLEKVEQISRFVNAHMFIEKLPDKYFAPVAERGMTLSSGQRQLLSFARALAFDPKVLILDEATSSVDVETEHYIQEAISRLIRGKTSIIIAHRLSTIKNVDRILVIHKGELKEAGSHEELLAHKGFYHKLYQLQLADSEKPI